MTNLIHALEAYGDASNTIAEHPAQSLRVMVIDDEEGYSRFVASAVIDLGHEAEFATSIGPALQQLMRCPPDIIFLDVGLVNSDAIDVIRGLSDLRFRGVLQLMSGDWRKLLTHVHRVGQRHGLILRPPLQKPFRADAVRRVIDEFPTDVARPTPLRAAPPQTIELDEALAREWIELWYQPKMDLASERCIGLEGLARCRHPEYGILSPDSFLRGAPPIAMAALSEFAISTALLDWQHIADLGVNVRIAVNVPMSVLASMRLPALVRTCRPRSPLWPGLIVEVTEDEVTRDIGLAHEVATQLSIYGLHLSIDDFGEGYSSFARLNELPFAELKLDKSFVRFCARDTRKAAICKSVIELAHGYGASAVAEGLENWADVEAIRDLGCDIGQGFVFARPMPRSVLGPMLAQDSHLRRT